MWCVSARNCHFQIFICIKIIFFSLTTPKTPPLFFFPLKKRGFGVGGRGVMTSACWIGRTLAGSSGQTPGSCLGFPTRRWSRRRTASPMGAPQTPLCCGGGMGTFHPGWLVFGVPGWSHAGAWVYLGGWESSLPPQCHGRVCFVGDVGPHVWRVTPRAVPASPLAGPISDGTDGRCFDPEDLGDPHLLGALPPQFLPPSCWGGTHRGGLQRGFAFPFASRRCLAPHPRAPAFPYGDPHTRTGFILGLIFGGFC